MRADRTKRNNWSSYCIEQSQHFLNKKKGGETWRDLFLFAAAFCLYFAT